MPADNGSQQKHTLEVGARRPVSETTCYIDKRDGMALVGAAVLDRLAVPQGCVSMAQKRWSPPAANWRASGVHTEAGASASPELDNPLVINSQALAVRWLGRRYWLRPEVAAVVAAAAGLGARR